MKSTTNRSLLRGAMAGLAAAGALLSAHAFATPVLPANTGVVFKFNNYDSPFITQTGQVESGIFAITSINNALNPTITYWASGVSDQHLLVGYFTGLTSSSITPQGTQFEIHFTGGTMAMFEVPQAPNPFIPTNPTSTVAGLESQICGGACPAPYLTLDFVPGISLTDPAATEIATVNTITTTPVTGSGFGNLQVTGGTAASQFGLDVSYNSNFSSCPPAQGSNPAYSTLCSGAGNWPLVSFDPVTAVTVPEPGTLFLFGIAVLIGGTLTFRRRTA